MEPKRPIGFADPQSTKINVAGLHRLLVEMELMRDGGLAECDVVFCEKARHEHFLQLRAEQDLDFRLNQIPRASQRLQQKQKFTDHFAPRPYALKTYRESCRRRLRGVWVEKPFNVDRGEGITFLRDPRGWQRPKHILQRYLGDPWLLGGKKTEVRLLARLDDDGTAVVHREGLVRVAAQPFTLESLDPMIHNANALFQKRMGVGEVEQYLLTEVAPDPRLLERMVEIVHDTTAILKRDGRFGGTRDFEAIGYDFVVDRTGRPFLIEANRAPGLYLEPSVCERFYRGMARALYSDL